MTQTIKLTSIRPKQSLNLLSHTEISDLILSTDSEVHRLFRLCALAVLNTGTLQDNAHEILRTHESFEIDVIPQSRGLKLDIYNAPGAAFVDGTMIRGIQDHVFAALRDIAYTHYKIHHPGGFDLNSSAGITDAIFRILRNAHAVRPHDSPNLVICWGGHSISRTEYDYTKEIGYQLGLRGIDIGTGCGPGAMKGPMKGATIGHAKQQKRDGRYIGISEPGIIASEPPNPIVNELVILPDIEKRLETFIRLSHAIIVFPGGVGTAEEILFLLGVLMHPKNQGIPFPLIFTAPDSSRDYFKQIDQFLVETLGEQVRRFYQLIVGNSTEVARQVKAGLEEVHQFRRNTQEAYCFNWQITIPPDFQKTFDPTHENMSSLVLDKKLPAHELAANLRRAFSGIVAGNVKEDGINHIKQHGPYIIDGDPELMTKLDTLLQSFVSQKRMKLDTNTYSPCYTIKV